MKSVKKNQPENVHRPENFFKTINYSGKLLYAIIYNSKYDISILRAQKLILNPPADR